MVAAVVLEEVQVAELVKSCVLLSENVPVALNCIVAPALSEAFAGVTTIEVSAAPVTDTVTLAVREPEEAWIVALPTPAPVAKPVGLIETIAGLEDVQVAAVNGCVLPFASFPVTEKATVPPFGILPGEGETEIDTNPDEVFIILSPVTISGCTKPPTTGILPPLLHLCYRQFRFHIRLCLLRLVVRSRRVEAVFSILTEPSALCLVSRVATNTVRRS
jgi:hypothetical protein